MLECIVFWSIQMIEILILYILTKYDCTIYKIKKLIEEKFFMYSMPSLGAVNPALKKLESLSCVEFESKMSGGGILSKTYKITSFGQKYLQSTIASFEFKNKSNIICHASILICVSDVLEDDGKISLYKNCLNNLLILKADIISALQNPYNMFTKIQENTIKTNVALIDEMVKILK